MKATARQIEEKALGYTAPARIYRYATKDGRTLVIYRSERDFGTYAAAKVVGEDGKSRAALLRLAARLEERELRRNVYTDDRDRVGNPLLWVEGEERHTMDLNLKAIEAAAELEGWRFQK